MGITRERVDGMSDRELECLLAKIFYQHSKDNLEVRGEFLWSRSAPWNEDLSASGMPVPRYVSTWQGFGEALSNIDVCNFNVELYLPADRRALRRAVVTQRYKEETVRAEASHANLRKALALAAILVMYGAWYEGDRG